MNTKEADLYFDFKNKNLSDFFKNVLELPELIQVFAIDKELKYVLFNDNYRKHIKDNFNIDIKLGDSLTEIFKDFKDLNKEKSILGKALNGEGFSQVGNFKSKSELIYYKDIYKPVKNNKGEIIGVIVFYTDITPRKKNQIVLEVLLNISEKANQYENLGEYIGFIRNELGKIIDTTNFFVALYDQNTEKYSFPYFVDEYDKIDALSKYDLSKSATDYVRRSGKPIFINKEISEKLVKDKEIEIIGTIAPSWIGLPLKTEEGIIGVLVAQNYNSPEGISSGSLEIMEFVSDHIAQAVERKQSEDSIKIIAHELQYAQGIAKLGRCDINLITSKVSFSLEAKRIFGLDENKDTYNLQDIKNSILGNKKEILMELMTPLLDNKVKELNFKIINNKTKEIVYINSKSKIEISNKKRPDRLVLMVQDTTKQEKDKLELKLAKEKSEMADKLKSAFLANMSHEIRTPMNAILGFSKLLVQDNLSKETREKYAEYINSSGNNLMQLINDIIDVAKIEAGQLSISKTFLNINKLLDELYATIDQQRIFIKKHNIKLILNKSIKGGVLLYSDPVRLRQILINLLGNALKFTEKGEIEFGYNIENKKKIIFYVKDTGTGIPKDKEDIIFSRFGQIIDNEIIHPGGTGLGLSITKNLVELLGGNIYLDSTLGKGATFSFNLPYITKVEEDENIEETKNKEVYSSQKKLSQSEILIVEDNEANRELVSDLISGSSGKHNIDFAETGEKAKELFLKKKYDLIFMDIKLPDIDGLKVAKFIRSSKDPNKRTPIVALSAHAMAEIQEKAFDAGVDEFISKPFIFENLMQILNKYLNKKNINPNENTMSENNFEHIDLSILAPLYVTKPERLKFIVEQYAKTIDDNMLKLKNFIEQKDTDKLKIAAHSLKSSFAYLGINNASEISKEIENNNTQVDNASYKYKDINIMWENAKIEIEEFLKKD